MFSLISRQKLRARALAGDRRAGEWARAKARRAQYQFIRRNWRRMALLAFITVLPGLLVLQFLQPLVAGFLLGVLLTGVAAAVWFWTVQATGTAPTMAGDTAEQWTAMELRRLRRRGWRLVNRVLLKRQDVDHVLIGPGGVFAVETKWTATPWQLDPPEDRVRRAAAQASESARDLQLWQPFKMLALSVQPVVFLWGAGLSDLNVDQHVRTLDGVVVVAGPHAKRWRQHLPDGLLEEKQIDGGWSALDRQVRTRDDRDPLHTPPSAFEIYVHAVLVTSSFTAGLLVSAQLFRLTPLWGWLAGSLLLAVAAGVFARRWSALRLAATAMCVGASSAVVVIGAVLLWQLAVAPWR